MALPWTFLGSIGPRPCGHGRPPVRMVPPFPKTQGFSSCMFRTDQTHTTRIYPSPIYILPIDYSLPHTWLTTHHMCSIFATYTMLKAYIHLCIPMYYKPRCSIYLQTCLPLQHPTRFIYGCVVYTLLIHCLYVVLTLYIQPIRLCFIGYKNGQG